MWIPRACCKVSSSRRVETEPLETEEIEGTKNEQEPQYEFSGYADEVVSRMHTVNPKEDERYYLQTQLFNVAGANSHEDMRIVDDKV